MICWVDVETTGLDPQKDTLLEVGVILTTDNLGEVDRTSVVLSATCAQLVSMKSMVYDMHEKSGLIAAVETEGVELEEATSRLVQWLLEREAIPVMAGNTVGFDRAWLRAKMPLFEALFHYRSIDVSSLKELNARWGFAPKWEGDRKIHRSLPDLEDSIAELQHYRVALSPAVPA